MRDARVQVRVVDRDLSTVRGKVMGSRPEGMVRPSSRFAIAGPPMEPDAMHTTRL